MTPQAAYLLSRVPVSTGLSSAELEASIPAQLREQAFFSARTALASHLQETRDGIARLLDGRAAPARIRAEMKKRLAALGYQPSEGERGGIRDLSSDARTNLIISQNEARANGYARWRSQQTPAKLARWPGQQMYRAKPPRNPRDWQARWNEARSALGTATGATEAARPDGPFAAPRNDPIWAAVSRFSNPFPPFDYNSTMRVRLIGPEECGALGVRLPAAPQKPRADPMLRTVRCDRPRDPALAREFAAAFGGRARDDGDGHIWVAPPPPDFARIVDERGKSDAALDLGFAPEAHLAAISRAVGQDIPGHTVLRVTTGNIRHAYDIRHGPEASDPPPGNIPISLDDVKKIPDLLRGRGKWEASGRKGGGIRLLFRPSGTGLVIPFSYSRGNRNHEPPRLVMRSMWREREMEVGSRMPKPPVNARSAPP